MKNSANLLRGVAFTLMLLFSSFMMFAQNITVTGTVTDATFKDPVIGATIVVEGDATHGTATDVDGNFTLPNVAPNATLIISYVGMQTQRVEVNGRTRIDIVLQDDTEILEEVVVTGYGGTQLRSKTTNSIAKVKNEALTVGIFSNPAQALSGAVSGLRVVQTSGDPGATPRIVLRGGTNLDGSGSPLIIIDGQIRAGLNDINPEDIESMEVLKDAGATAIYGARASNGVILVTTKTGKKGTSQIDFKAKMGWNYVNSPYTFLGAEDYIRIQRQAIYNTANLFKYKDGSTGGYTSTAMLTDPNRPFSTGNVYGQSPFNSLLKTPENSHLLQKGWQEMADPLDPNKTILFKDTDIASWNLNNPTISQDYNISVSGGNEKGSYYSGIGYNYSNALPIDTWYKRYSFLTNGSYNIREWLSTTTNVSYNRANWRGLPPTQTNVDNYFGRVMSMPPTLRFEDEEGNMLLGLGRGDENMQYNVDKFLRFNQTDKFTLGQTLNVDLMKGLSLKASGIWYFSEGLYESFNKDFEVTPGVFNRNRSTSGQYTREFAQTYNAVLNYKNTFGKHDVSGLVGTEFYDTYYRMLYAAGSGAPTDDFADLGYTDTDKGKRDIDSQHTQRRILSYFGRANYDYAEKYLFSAVFRYDGYSSLLGDNRWGFFPGLSTGWIFGREDFVKNALPALSFGKLRASYGVNGNASGIGPYTLQGSYNTAQYNGLTGYLIGNLPNAPLRWEKTTTFEVGADLSFFENRLNTNFTFYNRLTSDKYANLSFPTSVGFSSILNNNGDFQNRGIEMEISGTILETPDWKWTANANIAYNRNKVVRLPDNGLERNRIDAYEVYTGNKLSDGTDEKIWVGGYQEGQEPGVLYLHVAEGIYKSYDEIPGDRRVKNMNFNKMSYGPAAWDALTLDQQKNAFPIQPGDVKWKDVNGDGLIDEFDRVKIGNTTPRWIGGFNTTLSWKNLAFYARFDYAFGYWVYDNTTSWFLGNMQGTFNTTTQVFDTWSEDNPNAKLPRYLWADQLGKANYFRASTLSAYKGDYLAVRELSLSYSLPEAWANKVKMQRANISLTGQNLG